MKDKFPFKHDFEIDPTQTLEGMKVKIIAQAGIMRNIEKGVAKMYLKIKELKEIKEHRKAKSKKT
jgi:hypothetical protein